MMETDGKRMDSRILPLQLALLDWFERSARDLPWRTDYDPYHVWISEIMLQQTQMERGVYYFRRWLTRFPDISAVAVADEQEILKYWEGLGYYARARNLHKAARIIIKDHQTRVPDSYDALLALPGIGPYTAAAIASIAYNLDIAVVDANVERVLSRLFDIDAPIKNPRTKKEIRKLAETILPSGKARLFNQALMDLGGLVCTPKNPLCEECPAVACCMALQTGHVHERPVVSPAGKTIPIEMATGVLAYRGRIFIQQRLADDVWGSLWEFPGGRLETGETPEEAVVREFKEETGFNVEVIAEITTVIHHYMRYKVTLHGFSCRLTEGRTEPALHAAQDFRWVRPHELADYGFPAGHRKLIDYMAASCEEDIHP
jgi:A/G-specific adenine glycosylase